MSKVSNLTQAEQDEMFVLMSIITDLMGLSRMMDMVTSIYTSTSNDIGPESMNEYWAIRRYYDLKRKAVGESIVIKTGPGGEVLKIIMGEKTNG